MKNSNLLLLAGAGALAYYFLSKKQTTAAPSSPDLMTQAGNSLDSMLNFLGGLFSSIIGQQKISPSLADYTSANQRGMLPTTPDQLTKRWLADNSIAGVDSRGGIIMYGAYSPTALQASATSKLYGANAAITEVSNFAASYSGYVGTAYSSSGSSIPVAVVPNRNSNVVGLYTTLDAYIAQSTGKAPSSSSAATASGQNAAYYANLASLYSRGILK